MSNLAGGQGVAGSNPVVPTAGTGGSLRRGSRPFCVLICGNVATLIVSVDLYRICWAAVAHPSGANLEQIWSTASAAAKCCHGVLQVCKQDHVRWAPFAAGGRILPQPSSAIAPVGGPRAAGVKGSDADWSPVCEHVGLAPGRGWFRGRWPARSDREMARLPGRRPGRARTCAPGSAQTLSELDPQSRTLTVWGQ